ncbi:unnamed protein product [Oreochromis niloticus]|nr:unnamed protein product [Mustela putorius furo]
MCEIHRRQRGRLCLYQGRAMREAVCGRGERLDCTAMRCQVGIGDSSLAFCWRGFPIPEEGPPSWAGFSHNANVLFIRTEALFDVRERRYVRFVYRPNKGFIMRLVSLGPELKLFWASTGPAVCLQLASGCSQLTHGPHTTKNDGPLVAQIRYRVVIMMRVNICCCLFAFFLGCNVTADIKNTIIRDKDSVTLDCPVSVEGNVTWSRKNSGRIVDILTADGNTERRHIDDTRFKSSADKSLIILRPAASDTGTYLCNNKPAVLLTVISPANATSAPPTNSDHQLLLGLIYGTAASFIFIIIIIIIVASVFSPARHGSNKQGSERKEHVYHYIIDDVRFKAENAPSQDH